MAATVLIVMLCLGFGLMKIGDLIYYDTLNSSWGFSATFWITGAICIIMSFPVALQYHNDTRPQYRAITMDDVVIQTRNCNTITMVCELERTIYQVKEISVETEIIENNE